MARQFIQFVLESSRAAKCETTAIRHYPITPETSVNLWTTTSNSVPIFENGGKEVFDT